MSFPFIFEYDEKIYLILRHGKKIKFVYMNVMNFLLSGNLNQLWWIMFQHQYNGFWKRWFMVDVNKFKSWGWIWSLFRIISILFWKCYGYQWVSHPNNPIYIDPLIARNGGILFDDDQILGYVNDRDLINMDMKVGFIVQK